MASQLDEAAGIEEWTCKRERYILGKDTFSSSV